MDLYSKSIFISTFLISVVSGICPDINRWDPVTSNCYIFSEEKTDWFTAKATCEERGAFLAKIESQAEMDFLYSKSPHPTGHHWFGMNDLAIEGDFRWLDGTSVQWFDWRREQPNGGADQNCTTIDNNWEWQDKDCAEQYYFVCTTINGNALYGSNKVTLLTDVEIFDTVKSLGRIDCADRCTTDLRCAYWAYSDSSSSSNCKFYKVDSGKILTMSTSWDYYKLEWISKENVTST